MTAKKKIVITLGGSEMSDEAYQFFIEYLLEGTGKKEPRVCLIHTASGDSEEKRADFYRHFEPFDCRPSHLALFQREVDDVAKFLSEQDLIYVSGGNTANMLAIWQVHGVDVALRQAYENGVILAGSSAGAVCWFEMGVTSSFGSEMQEIAGLGLLPGSFCPHYSLEEARRPAYHRLLKAGLIGGYAADDGVALCFVDGKYETMLPFKDGGKAFKVGLRGGEIEETELEMILWG